MADRRSLVAGGLFALVVLGAVFALARFIAHSERLPEGPVPVAWDREACAHCKMHVSEPRFAAQLQLKDGRVLQFDDPGCALEYRRKVPPESVHALYFHHLREDAWILAAQVAFVQTSPTPMAYGLGAVRQGEGTISLEQAAARVRAGPVDERRDE